MPTDPKPWLRPVQYTHEGPALTPPGPRDRPPPPVPSAVTAIPAPTNPNPTTVPTHLLDVGDLADMLKIHRRTVWRWAAAGRLPQPVTIGRVRRWRKDRIARLIADNCPMT